MLYFDKFPQIQYDIFKNGKSNKILFTNILTRVKVLDSIKNNVFAYYDYVVNDEDTIEILAEKYYGNQEYHWVIALANDMTDPVFDWPRRQREFNKYITSKYGSQANAATTIHHYEKVITRQHSQSNITDEIIIELTQDVWDDLPATSFDTFNLIDGSTINETITKRSIDCYAWEVEENERRRHIKLIKRIYLDQILREFNNLMVSEGNNNLTAGLRSLRSI